MAYAKAMRTGDEPQGVDLADLESGFRESGMNAHLVAKEKEIPLDYTIVDFMGNPDKKYVLGIQWSTQSRRRAFREMSAEDPAENLERLKDCGLVMDRGVPVCSNCGGKLSFSSSMYKSDPVTELGHIRKHCKEEPRNVREERKCNNCGEAGHRTRECTQARKDKFACKNCGKSGHKASDCTEPRSAEGVECKRCEESKSTSVLSGQSLTVDTSWPLRP